MPETLDARPTKGFFIENLARDLSLEDAILDLVDNAIDSLIRIRGLDVSPDLLRLKGNGTPISSNSSPLITIQISDKKVEILDRCGGIDLERARHYVFRFGRAEPAGGSTLGVYGIGLKRAIFKIGKNISIESHTLENGFRVHIDVPQWADDDESWELPFEALGPAPSVDEAGTRITITDLNPEAVLRINDGTLMAALEEAIAATYSLFLTRFLTVALNGSLVQPQPLPIGMSDELTPASKTMHEDSVTVELVAGLAARRDGEWNAERAGWYVLCNGRVVVSADKTELTGWGVFAPTFVSKLRGFVGIAFFFSRDPATLPWTTTKRGLNRESKVYQIARKEMSGISRPIIQFLNRMYPSEPAEEIEERRLADQLKLVDMSEVLERAKPVFSPPRDASGRRKKTTVSVQYPAERADVERIKKKLNKPNWSAGSVGRFTFDYYLRAEFPE